MILQNDRYLLEIDAANGVITRLYDRIGGLEIITEPRLGRNFQLLIPLPEYEANYIEGTAQQLSSLDLTSNGAILRWDGPLSSAQGCFDVSVEETISFVDDAVEFHLRVTNRTSYKIAEVVQSYLGGIQGIGERRDTVSVYATSQGESPNLFRHFTESMGIGCGVGAPYGECVLPYPNGENLQMPWISFGNSRLDRSLYFGCHDLAARSAMMRFELHPNIAHNREDGNWPLPEDLEDGAPLGLVMSWVNFPYTKSGETFESGRIVFCAHQGDWHDAAMIYRRWFAGQFPIVRPEENWIRREQALQDILYLVGEDTQFGSFRDIPQLAKDGLKYGITTVLISGWDLRGHDGCYPYYEPDPRVGAWEELEAAVRECHALGVKVCIFANINQAHVDTAWFRRELHRYQQKRRHGDGYTYGYGMGTINARFNRNGRPMTDLSPSFPEYRRIIVEKMKRLALTGVDGIHLDKIESGISLDYNPDLPVSPDRSTFEGMLAAVKEITEACQAINPGLAISTECNAWDRVLSYSPVTWNWGWQNEHRPVARFAFPEWLPTIAIASQYDYATVNHAVRYGFQMLIAAERFTKSIDYPPYRTFARYLAEVLRLRAELADFLFYGEFRDTLGARVEGDPGIRYSVYRNRGTEKRACVLVNVAGTPGQCTVTFEGDAGKAVQLFRPFHETTAAETPLSLTIEVNRLMVVVEQ